MTKFELTILGNNSAIPAYGRFPTSQVLNINEQLYLIDCGEGTQIQLQQFKVRSGKIDHIFISHLHGDHYYGLIGLITSFHLNHREKALNIYGPPGLADIITVQLKASNTQLCYPLHFHPILAAAPETILELGDITVSTVLMDHRIPCTGFVFREKPKPRKILPEKTDEYAIPISFMQRLKNGEDYVTEDGKRVPNAAVTADPPPTRSYAFCTDTAYKEDNVPLIKGVDLLYHEATFGEDSAYRAAETHHSTAKQAATIAKMAGVNRLLIGHFSAKYKELDHLQEEARSIFPNTDLALAGHAYGVPQEKEAPI